jgi:hypothetical protein
MKRNQLEAEKAFPSIQVVFQGCHSSAINSGLKGDSWKAFPSIQLLLHGCHSPAINSGLKEASWKAFPSIHKWNFKDAIPQLLILA